MPTYTPPAGNAANFDFTLTGYSPPAGNALVFNFGVDTPGGGVVAKPAQIIVVVMG
jgi:hypothetical protein